jgi:hypothetical protein
LLEQGHGLARSAHADAAVPADVVEAMILEAETERESDVLQREARRERLAESEWQAVRRTADSILVEVRE